MTDRPNILLLMTDQHRGDCLGIEDHPVLQTPYLDEMGGEGLHFRKAYTSCPVCIPARRTLMSGRKPANHGVLMNYGTHMDCPTLPGELSKAGYQTHLCGKLHLWPDRKLYGFDSADWSDGPHKDGGDDDYQRFLREQGLTYPAAGSAHGMNVNGYPARPFHLDERFHFTNWVTDRALNFLERRDPTAPFFLKVSYLHPHQPLTPPQCYWDRYINMDLPEPKVGDWARIYDEPQDGQWVCAWRFAANRAVQKQMQAGYYGCINHIDNQIGRILNRLPKDTVIIFTADHGEMLGDHQWIRKRSAFEPSARIPFLMRFPKSMGIEQMRKIDEAVELMDVMPTLLDVAGVDIPSGVDGKSLMPLLRGEDTNWRDYVHGECADVPTENTGMQYLTDGKKKFIYHPGPGREYFFDLENDPDEMHDLSADPAYAKEIDVWRKRLIKELEGRPEGFTDGKKLNVLGSNTSFCMPGYENSNPRFW